MIDNYSSTVAASMRTIQQGINEAKVAGINLQVDLIDKIDTLKNKVEFGSVPFLEKMQKGKDDAWALTFGGIQRTDGDDEDTDDYQPHDNECVIWSEPYYGGDSQTIVNDPNSSDWQPHWLHGMNLGSFKCGSNLRVWFDNPEVSAPAIHAAGSRGYVENPVGPQVALDSATTLKFFEANHESANVFTNDNCSGGSTFLWTDHANENQTQVGLVFGDFMSARIPMGVQVTFYPVGGEPVTLHGQDDSDGYAVCQQIGQASRSALLSYIN